MKRPDLFGAERSPREPQQSRSRLRREAILRAANVRFGRDGFERASVRGIAREAGVATGSVYQFFPSKRYLLLVSMDALLSRLEKVKPPPFTERKTLLSEMEKFLEKVFARERPFVGVYRAWQEAALVDTAIAAHDRRIRAWSGTRVRNLFALLTGLSGTRSGQDLTILAQLWDRFFWNLLAHPPLDRKAAARSLARMLYHTLFFDSRADRDR